MKENIFEDIAENLIRNLLPLVKVIPADDEGYKKKYSEADASHIYGKGWMFMLSIEKPKIKSAVEKHWLQLSAYHLPVSYKSSILLKSGSKEEIISALQDKSVLLEIISQIPKLHWCLEDV